MPTGDCNSVCTEWLLCGVFLLLFSFSLLLLLFYVLFSVLSERCFAVINDVS